MVLMTAVAVLATAATATAETRADIRIDIRESGDLDVRVEQSWTSDSASSFRHALDEMFGEADGRLTRTDIGRIEEATAADMENKTFPMVVVGNGTSRVREVTVDIVGGEGRVRSTSDIALTHDLTLDAGLEPGAEEHRIVVTPPRSGTLSIGIPLGSEVRATENLTDAKAEGGNLTGRFEADARVIIVIGAAADAPGEGVDTGRFGVPAPGVLASLVGVAAAAALGLAGRRARR